MSIIPRERELATCATRNKFYNNLNVIIKTDRESKGYVDLCFTDIGKRSVAHIELKQDDDRPLYPYIMLKFESKKSEILNVNIPYTFAIDIDTVKNGDDINITVYTRHGSVVASHNYLVRGIDKDIKVNITRFSEKEIEVAIK